MAPPANMYPPGTVLTVGSHTAVVKKYFSEGGFAHVYQVDISPKVNGTSVACLKRVAVPDKQSLNNLRAEVDSMKRLTGNRHIVSYIDSHAARMNDGTNSYEVFVLMEFCENKGLIDFMNTRLQHRLTEPEVLRIMGEVTEGVCNMHALSPPLVHRDIKIENVLISGNGDYKLCDFGSASMVLRPPRNSDEFAILQNDVLKNTTPQYRSPEMVDLYRGLPIDEKSDIWALGVFLYKLCYYTTPFEAKGELAILHAQFTFPHSPAYSDRMKNLIKVLLREDPRRRPNAYQTLEEVCNMRDIPVPIKDYTKKKDVKPKVQSDATAPHHKKEPTVSRTQIPIQNVPISKAKYGYNKSVNSVNDLSALNNGPIQPPISSVAKPTKPDPFKALTPSALKQQALLDRPSPAISHPHYPIVSNVHNVNKSTDSLFINSASSAEKPIVSSKPKHIADVAQNKDDVKPKVPSRPIRPKRPQSMFISKSGSTSLDSKQVENNGTGSDLKRIISNLAATDKLSTSPKGNNHIDSNLEFLKNLEQQNSGKSWVQQTTGGSIRSISRLNTGSKRINSLISSFTGKFSRPSSASSSRASSIHENFGIRSENTGTSIKFRSSSESIEEETFDTPKGPPVLKKSNSIQRRVKQLMNRSYDPPIIKTAKGYGNDALKETKHRKGSIDSDGFTKPSIKIKPVAPAPSTSKPKAVPSTPPLSSQSTPNTVTKTPKQKIRELASPQSTLKKKVPPPKPKKPEHLRTIESSPRHDDKKKPLKQVASNNTSSQYLKVSNDGGLVKVHSLDSEISDFDEWEKKFHEKYPKAL